MANLLDTINQNSQKIAGQRQGVTDQTQSLSTLLAAKSGKAGGPGTDFASSNLGEQQAVAQTNNTLENELAPQAAAQTAATNQKAAGVAQNDQLQKSEVAQNNRFNNLQTQLQTNQILNDFEQKKGQISLDQDKAAASQVAQNLRLDTQKYVDELKLNGEKARLNDSLQFKKQMAEAAFGDNTQLIESKLGNKAILDASARDFSTAMGKMSVDDAWNIFNVEMQGAKDKQLYGSIGAGTTAVIGAYGSQQQGAFDSDYQDYKDNTKPANQMSYSQFQAANAEVDRQDAQGGK